MPCSGCSALHVVNPNFERMSCFGLFLKMYQPIKLKIIRIDKDGKTFHNTGHIKQGLPNSSKSNIF